MIVGADMYVFDFWDWLCSGGLRSNSLEQKKVYSHSDSQSQSPSRSTVIHELSRTCTLLHVNHNAMSSLVHYF